MGNSLYSIAGFASVVAVAAWVLFLTSPAPDSETVRVADAVVAGIATACVILVMIVAWGERGGHARTGRGEFLASGEPKPPADPPQPAGRKGVRRL